LTVPQALKDKNIRKLREDNKKARKFAQVIKNEEDSWNYKEGINNYLEIDNYIKLYSIINSRRKLQIILSIEEMDFQNEEFIAKQCIQLSFVLVELITLKFFFYSNYMSLIFSRLR
jgi:hypothetical protein